ncbi:MAG: hypothetical protein AAF556_13245, partial [Pseudomonadota bacterium]
MAIFRVVGATERPTKHLPGASIDWSIIFNQAVRYLPKTGIVYLNNPKAACSTIKRTLIWHETDGQVGDVNPNTLDYFLNYRHQIEPLKQSFRDAVFITA